MFRINFLRKSEAYKVETLYTQVDNGWMYRVYCNRTAAARTDPGFLERGFKLAERGSICAD